MYSGHKTIRPKASSFRSDSHGQRNHFGNSTQKLTGARHRDFYPSLHIYTSIRAKRYRKKVELLSGACTELLALSLSFVEPLSKQDFSLAYQTRVTESICRVREKEDTRSLAFDAPVRFNRKVGFASATNCNSTIAIHVFFVC